MPTHNDRGDESPHSKDGRTTNASYVLLAICLGLTATLCIGCRRDDGPERVVVSGEVTYNGKPVPQGRIRFTPLPDYPVPASGAAIIDGKYSVDSHGGVPVGTHAIQIEAYHTMPLKPGGLPPPMNRGMGKIGQRQYLPTKYNANTQLKVKIDPGSRAIAKNFDLTD